MNHSRNSVRKLTMLALLTAMSIVFARVLSISTGFVRFNLGSLPTLLAAVLFGPVEGFAVGAVADMIGGTLSGYAINPLITLGAGSIGLTAGLLWRALPNRGWACAPRSACLPAMRWAPLSSTRWHSTSSITIRGACW